MNVLGKVLGFMPKPSFNNEASLKRDFEDFARKMRCEWYFQDDTTKSFSQLPFPKINLVGIPLRGTLHLISKPEGDIFSVLLGNTAANLWNYTLNSLKGNNKYVS